MTMRRLRFFRIAPCYCQVKKNSSIFSTFWGVRVARPNSKEESFDMPMTAKKKKGAKRKATRKAASARPAARKTKKRRAKKKA
jgi:hypothetical protein